VHYATQVLRRLLTLRYRHLLLNAGTCMQHSAPVAPPGEEGRKLPPYGWTSKNYVICVCFHCHRTSSYHTTNTLQGRRAKSHVDTQTIQPGLGDFVSSYSRPRIDPCLTSPLLQNPGGTTAAPASFALCRTHR